MFYLYRGRSSGGRPTPSARRPLPAAPARARRPAACFAAPPAAPQHAGARQGGGRSKVAALPRPARYRYAVRRRESARREISGSMTLRAANITLTPRLCAELSAAIVVWSPSAARAPSCRRPPALKRPPRRPHAAANTAAAAALHTSHAGPRNIAHDPATHWLRSDGVRPLRASAAWHAGEHLPGEHEEPWLQHHHPARCAAVAALLRPGRVGTRVSAEPHSCPLTLPRWVQREARPISLRQLTFFGARLTESRLLGSANYVRTELPTRYSPGVRELVACV